MCVCSSTKCNRRFFRLSHNSKYLLYFSTLGASQHPKNLKAAVDLRQATTTPDTSAGNDRQIVWTAKLADGTLRDFYLRADTASDAERWRLALFDAVDAVRKETATAAAAAAASQAAALAAKAAGSALQEKAEAAEAAAAPLSTEHFTPEEREKIVQLRARLDDQLTTPEQKDDANLLRFLRARDLVLKDAEVMWREHIAWRASFGLKEHYGWSYAENPPNAVPEFVREQWPQRFLVGKPVCSPNLPHFRRFTFLSEQNA